jgi:hypothetical protein
MDQYEFKAGATGFQLEERPNSAELPALLLRWLPDMNSSHDSRLGLDENNGAGSIWPKCKPLKQGVISNHT